MQKCLAAWCRQTNIKRWKSKTLRLCLCLQNSKKWFHFQHDRKTSIRFWFPHRKHDEGSERLNKHPNNLLRNTNLKSDRGGQSDQGYYTLISHKRAPHWQQTHHHHTCDMWRCVEIKESLRGRSTETMKQDDAQLRVCDREAAAETQSYSCRFLFHLLVSM